MPANHTAVAAYTAALALEVAAAVCVGIDVLRARQRAKNFQLAVRASTRTHGLWSTSQGTAHATRALTGGATPNRDDTEPLTATWDQIENVTRDLDEVRRQLQAQTPQMLAIAVDKADAAVRDFASLVEENLTRLTEAADVTGKRKLALIGVALLSAGIVVGFLGNLSSSGAF